MYFTKAQEKGSNHFVLYFLTMILILASYILLPNLLIIGVYAITKDNALLNSIVSEKSPLLWIIQSFAGIISIATLFLSIKFFHKRKIHSLLTGTNQFRFDKLFKAAALWLALCILPELIIWFIQPTSYQWTFEPKNISFMLMMIPVIIIMASFEELIFRGYLLQGLGLATKNKIIAVLITAILFGSAHLTNPEIKNYGLLFMAPQYILMGIFFGILVLMENGLEMVMGIHIINNLYGGILVGFEGSVMPIPTFFKVQEYNPKLGLISLFICIALFLIVYFIAAKYKKEMPWRKIIGKITKYNEKL